MKQRENLVSLSLDSSMLPLQFTPSPKYPGLQVHVKERLVLVQYANLQFLQFTIYKWGRDGCHPLSEVFFLVFSYHQ